MKLSRRTFLHLAAGAAALPAVSRLAWAQTYGSVPAHVMKEAATLGWLSWSLPAAGSSDAKILEHKLPIARIQWRTAIKARYFMVGGWRFHPNDPVQCATVRAAIAVRLGHVAASSWQGQAGVLARIAVTRSALNSDDKAPR
jgi:hypothetical protein